MDSGYLYALANESMPGVFKVGCTSRNPFERAKELRTTGVPTPFFVVATILVPDMRLAEASAHALLALRGERVDGNREFFATTLPEIMQAFAEQTKDLSESVETGYSTSDTLVHEKALADARAHHLGYDGVFPDFKKAIKLYERAVQLGSRDAAGFLWKIYSVGSGVRKSPDKATYFRRRWEELEPPLEPVEGERWEALIADLSAKDRLKYAENLEMAFSLSGYARDIEIMKLIFPHTLKNGKLNIFWMLDVYDRIIQKSDPKSIQIKDWLLLQFDAYLPLGELGPLLYDALSDLKRASGDLEEIRWETLRKRIDLCVYLDPYEKNGIPYEKIKKLNSFQIRQLPIFPDNPTQILRSHLRGI